ncbi:hypothetical protein ACA910_011945 [Epithemia clementina (nom. ined.)]
MENKRLTSEIAELREEMRQWSLRRTAQDQPAPPPSSLQPSPIDYASIVTAVIQTLNPEFHSTTNRAPLLVQASLPPLLPDYRPRLNRLCPLQPVQQPTPTWI